MSDNANLICDASCNTSIQGEENGSKSSTAGYINEEVLLDQYLSLSVHERGKVFANTGYAARLAGKSHPDRFEV